MNRKVSIVSFFVLAILIIVLPFVLSVPHTQQQTQQHASVNFPQVVSTYVLDENGKPLTLHGVMLDTFFAYYNDWGSQQLIQQDYNTIFTDTVFKSLQAWHVNVVRLNISEWLDVKHTFYRTYLDDAVALANKYNMYVVIDFHDNLKAGAPTQYQDNMLHTISEQWWLSMAQHYQSNPKVLFDLINEPGYPDWCSWMYGSNWKNHQCASTLTGTDIVGVKDLVTALRQANIQNLMVVEPGKAGYGSGNNTQGGGWQGYNPALFTDKNTVFSKHDYASITADYLAGKGIQSNVWQLWDREWDQVLNKRPLYYGEWAVNPHPQPTHSGQCTGLNSNNADAIAKMFLDYTVSRNIYFTAWWFAPTLLINSFSNPQATTFSLPKNKFWSCDDISAANLGMGQDLQSFLLSHY